MNHHDELKQAKLQMLQAIARSQAALANIMEHTAMSAGQYQIPISLIREQLRSLAGYQSTMIAQLSGIQVKQVKRGMPVHRPWLNHVIKRPR